MKLEAMNTVTIGWDKGDKFAEVDLPSNHRLNNRLKRLHDKHPEDFERFVLNEDGTLYAQIPIRWIRIQRPSDNRHVFTEEETKEARERAKAVKNSVYTEE